MGTLIAWVLVRDRFPGKRALEVLIDIPFALPTIVAGLVLLSLYGPNSPLGHRRRQHPRGGRSSRSLFVTLPFVVRTVQPVLEELERDVEEAAASLGAEPVHHLPADHPAQPGPGDRGGRRAVVRPGDQRVRLAGAALGQPADPTEVTSVRVLTYIENGNQRRRGRGRDACCWSSRWSSSSPSTSSSGGWRAVAEHVPAARAGRRPLRAAADRRRLPRSCWWPGRSALVVKNTFADGLDRADATRCTTPTSIHALELTVVVAVIAVVHQPVFGVGISLLLVRYQFPGKRVLSALIDLPLAVSPVVVGLALLLVYGGRDGWFGPTLENVGFQVIFATPGMILATVFVALPLVIREVVPVLEEIGDDQEQAARSLGANAVQTFRRITLPASSGRVVYGVVLSLARSLGEFGAVKVVSGNVARQHPDRHPASSRQKYQNFEQATRVRHGVPARACVAVACIVIVIRSSASEGADSMSIEVRDVTKTLRRLRRPRRRVRRASRPVS